MPNPIVAFAGNVAGSALSANAQKKAGESAAAAQVKSGDAAIDEQRRQFDAIQELMAPFIKNGSQATSMMAALAGVKGADSQDFQLRKIESSPQLQNAIEMGENALLQNASATGGLRGGNTQAALAQLSPALYSQAIDQRYGQLQGLAGMGQASAAGQASMGQATGNNISGLLTQQGQALAGSALATGKATQSAIGGIAGSFGNLASYSGAMPQGASIFGRWGF